MVVQVPTLAVLSNTLNAADTRKAKALLTDNLPEILVKMENIP